jgi:light-regulated signal transduction histidine kinase (bacteriophytochrome)
MQSALAFGQADLTNCERELIHLAGAAVQPHGALLVRWRRPSCVCCSSAAMCRICWAWRRTRLLQQPLAQLGGDVAERVAQLQRTAICASRWRCSARWAPSGARLTPRCTACPTARWCWSWSPRTARRGVELQDLAPDVMAATLSAALQRFGAAPSVGVLADAVVEVVRNLTGYDRVVVYKFDPDGHGKVIAEARHPRLESLLGHHYPASDIPQRARALYLLNRVRMLVDVDAPQAPLLPALLPGAGAAGHVAVPAAQHVAHTPAVPAQHGRHRDADRIAGA